MNTPLVLRVYPKPNDHRVLMSDLMNETPSNPSTKYIEIVPGTTPDTVWRKVNTLLAGMQVTYHVYRDKKRIAKYPITEDILRNIYSLLLTHYESNKDSPAIYLENQWDNLTLCFELIQSDIQDSPSLCMDSRLSVISMANRLIRKLAVSQQKLELPNGHRYVPPHLVSESGNGKVFIDTDDCIKGLNAHLAKGDIIDSIAYLMFLAELEGLDDKSQILSEAFNHG